MDASNAARPPTRLLGAIALCFIATVTLLGLGVYMVPADARAIYTPFAAFGEQATATVVDKRIVERAYEGGGRRRGTKTYEEHVVDVKLDGRTVSIDALVLHDDYAALKPGDDVEVTFIRGDKAREALPKGPYYLLSSSVSAGSLAYLGWAFNGRPAHPGAIFTVIPGLLFLLATGILISLARTIAKNQRTPSREPPNA